MAHHWGGKFFLHIYETWLLLAHSLIRLTFNTHALSRMCRAQDEKEEVMESEEEKKHIAGSSSRGARRGVFSVHQQHYPL